MEVEIRNAGIRFHEISLEAESLSCGTASSGCVQVVLDPLQGFSVVLVESRKR